MSVGYGNLPAGFSWTQQSAPTTGDPVYYGTDPRNGDTVYVGPDNQPYEWSGNGAMSSAHLGQKVSWTSLVPTGTSVNNTVVASTYSGPNASTAAQNDANYASAPAGEVTEVTPNAVSAAAPGNYSGGEQGAFSLGAPSSTITGGNLLLPSDTLPSSVSGGLTEETLPLTGNVVSTALPAATGTAAANTSLAASALSDASGSGTAAAIAALLGTGGIAGLLGADTSTGSGSGTGYDSNAGGYPTSVAALSALQPTATNVAAASTSTPSPVAIGAILALLAAIMFAWYHYAHRHPQPGAAAPSGVVQ